ATCTSSSWAVTPSRSKRTLARSTSHSGTGAWHRDRGVVRRSGLDELTVRLERVRVALSVEATDEVEQPVASQERIRCAQTGARPIAAPAPRRGLGAEARPHGIQYDVSTRLEEVRVRGDLLR